MSRFLIFWFRDLGTWLFGFLIDNQCSSLCQDVIDGDLCEQYPTLTTELQRKIADELDRTPGEILKKLEDIRNRII